MKTRQITENIIDNTIRMEQDHEVQMAREQLYRAASCAIELHDLLRNFSETQDLEAWVQAKITMAAEQLESVRNHLKYEVLSGEIPLVGGYDNLVQVDEMTSSGSIATSMAAPAAVKRKPMMKKR